MTKTNDFSKVVATLMEAVTLNEDGTLKVINQKAMDSADELLGSLIVEKARDWWAQLESAEDSLAQMSDEISFAELNADPSHLTTPAVSSAPKAAPSVAAAMEAAMGKPEFNLRGIFEADEDDPAPVDGDEQFDDMMRGDDDAGVGDGVDTDGQDELDGADDMDVLGAEDGEFDTDFGSDELGGDDLDGGFDFSFLDDAAGDELGGDQFGGDDLGGDDLGGDQFGDDELGGDDLGGDQFGDDELGDDLPPQ